MKKLFLIASLAGMGLSVSCSQEETADAPKGADLSIASYTVSVDEALAELQNTLDGLQTRGAGRTVADVQTLPASEIAGTRAAGEDAPLGYVVNFEEGGYAVLGADLRQDPVVAIVNENSMTPETLAAAKRAVDAGEEVDTPTFVNAMVADYLVRSLDENEPRLEIGSWEIKENKLSMMITKWGGNTHYGRNNPSTVAICQILLYNYHYNHIGFTQLGGYMPNWTILNIASTSPTLLSNCEGEVYRLCSTMDDTILMNQNGRTPIATVVETMKKFMRSYKMVQSWTISGVDDLLVTASGRIRNMLYLNNLPVYMEGTTTGGSRYSWVLDGWQMKQYSTGNGRQYLVYCNFGQGGVNDGIYSFGSFMGYNENLEYITYSF